MKKTIPAEGLTIAEIAALAITRGVMISFGVADNYKGQNPPIVTVQVQASRDAKPASFAMPFSPMNPMLGQTMSIALLEWIDKVAPKQTLIIQP